MVVPGLLFARYIRDEVGVVKLHTPEHLGGGVRQESSQGFSGLIVIALNWYPCTRLVPMRDCLLMLLSPSDALQPHRLAAPE